MKKIFYLAFIFLISSTLVFAGKKQELDRILVVVNDGVITQSELNDAIASYKKQLASGNTSAPAPEVLRKQVLDQLIDKKIQLQMGDMAGLKITDDQVNKAISTIATQNKMTINQLLEQVAKAGLKEKKYRQEIHDQLIMQTIQQQEIGSHIAITPEEVTEFMQSATWKAYNSTEYHLEDLLFALSNTPTAKEIADTEKEAREVMGHIQRGVSFSQVATAESANNHSLQGGDLGWVKLSQVPPSFSDKLVHLKKDDFFGPIATPNGFHVVRLVDTRPISIKTNKDEQQKQVQQIIYQRKFQAKLKDWLSKIRGEAYVNLHPES